MTTEARPFRLLRPPAGVLIAALAKLALLLSCASSYGYDREELYLLACTHHLAAGYLDRAPLPVLALAAVVRLYGENLLTVRVLAAVVAAFVVVLAARVAGALGATARGQTLTAVAVAAAPRLLVVDHAFGAHALDMLAVTTLALAATGALARDASVTAWARLGLASGVAVLGSTTGAIYALALALAVVVTLRRRVGPGELVAVAIAAAVCAPYVAWQRAHGWPWVATFRLSHDALWSGAGLLPVDLALSGLGIIVLLLWPRADPARARAQALGLAAAASWGALAVSGHTGGLPASYPVLLAGAATFAELTLAPRRWAHATLLGALALVGALSAPFALPVLRVGRYQTLARTIHLAPPPPESSLPQHFAGMFGWPEAVRATASVVASLPPEERDASVVLAVGAGRASALEVLGPFVGLPRVVSGSRSFRDWVAPGESARVTVVVGGDEESLHPYFGSVSVVTVFGHSLAAPDERRVRIFACRDPKLPLAAIVAARRSYD